MQLPNRPLVFLVLSVFVIVGLIVYVARPVQADTRVADTDVTKETFWDNVAGNDLGSLLASKDIELQVTQGCPYSRKQLEILADYLDKITVVNCDESPDMCGRKGVPAFRNRVTQKEVLGLQNLNELRDKLRGGSL